MTPIAVSLSTPATSVASPSVAPRWLIKAPNLFASAGACAIVLGLSFVIAFNWGGLNKFLKFGLIQGVIIFLTLAALWRGLATKSGKGLLVMAMGCLGPLLAVFGQTYQTGADVWQLFAAWAALCLPWAIASRSGGGWLLWIVLAQTALWLNLSTVFDLRQLRLGVAPLWLLVLGINGALLVGWEVAAKSLAWLAGRLAPRLIATVLLLTMTMAAIHSLFLAASLTLLHPLLGWSLLIAMGYFWYGSGQRDIVVAALGWVSMGVVALAIVIKMLVEISLVFTLFIGFFTVLGALWMGVQWLSKNFVQSNHWVIDVAAGFGAWFSMLLLVLFLGLFFGALGSDLTNTSFFWFLIAAVAAIAAVTLDRGNASSGTDKGSAVFRSQLTNVLALAAPTTAYWGVNIGEGRGGGTGLMAIYLACGVALVLWGLLRAKQTRSLMAIAATFGLVSFFEQVGLGWATTCLFFGVACLIWLLAPNSFMTDTAEIEMAANDSRIQRITEFGYSVSLWVLLIGVGVRSRDRWGLSIHIALPALLTFIIALIVGLALTRAQRKVNSPFSDPVIIGLWGTAVAVSAWGAPYLLICATFLAIGFCTVRLKLSALAGFGIVAALFEYYFEQSTPLWIKGSVLCTLGFLLVVIAWRILNRLVLSSPSRETFGVHP
jgi:uncharacterized membrane protein